MTKQSARNTIRDKTIRVLVQQLGLTPPEVAGLRLSHLHLAGKSPNISFTPAESEKPKTVGLDLEAHRALVGWLVARPDSKSDFLFPGGGDGGLDPREIEQIAAEAAPVEEPEPGAEAPDLADDRPAPDSDVPPPIDESILSGARPGPPLSRPEPPPSRPEMGAPPPGVDEAMVSGFRPVSPLPPTAPEVDESVNIPLPTSMPKPPSGWQPQAGAPADAPVAEPAEPAESAGPAGQVADQAPAAGEAEAKPGETQEAPAAGVSPEQPVKREVPARPVEKGAKPAPVRAEKPRRKLTAEQSAERSAAAGKKPSKMGRMLVPAVAAAIILVCAVCAGGGWFAWQSDVGRQLVAGLGGSSELIPEEATIELIEEIEATPEPVVVESPLESSPATPTLPPTSTPTALPTGTSSAPTETPTPFPTDTPAPQPTDTPPPTDTPVPTDTPAPVAPVDTATPTGTPTPSMKYDTPVLLEPENDFAFIPGNTLVLRWQPVDDLAPDEQYAVRLVYQYQGEVVFQGANVKEPSWTVPLSLFGLIDGPDNLYEWFVVVERLNDDGSGTAISPESDRRRFTWK